MIWMLLFHAVCKTSMNPLLLMKEPLELLIMMKKKKQEDLSFSVKENGVLFVTKDLEPKKLMLHVNKWGSLMEMSLMENLFQEELMFVLVITDKISVVLIICLLQEKFKNVQELKVPLKNVKLLNKLMTVDITLMLLLNAEDLETPPVLVKNKLEPELELHLLVN
jgi:hypothetical protein